MAIKHYIDGRERITDAKARMKYSRLAVKRPEGSMPLPPWGKRELWQRAHMATMDIYWSNQWLRVT